MALAGAEVQQVEALVGMDRGHLEAGHGRPIQLRARSSSSAGRSHAALADTQGAIAGLVEAGFVVVACGGGGIPVLRTSDGYLHGVEAVIDKDRTASLLARALDADVFVISTAVPRVAVDFGRPSQRWLERVTAAELVDYHADAQFPPGSMGPKVDAALSYLDAGGRQAVITGLDHIGPALAGEAGTIVTRDEPSAD